MDIQKMTKEDVFWLVVVHERAKAVHPQSHGTYPKGDDAVAN